MSIGRTACLERHAQKCGAGGACRSKIPSDQYSLEMPRKESGIRSRSAPKPTLASAAANWLLGAIEVFRAIGWESPGALALGGLT
jgi:hypothetical protein